MIYMPDALKAAIDLMNADPSKLTVRTSYNLTAYSFDPSVLATHIQAHIPRFEIEYEVCGIRQKIADSWPDSIDDSSG